MAKTTTSTMGEESVMTMYDVVIAEDEEDNDMLIISPPSLSDDDEHDIWELVNRSDADDLGSDSDSVFSIENGLMSLLRSSQPQFGHPQSRNGRPDLDPSVGGDDVYGHSDEVDLGGGDDDVYGGGDEVEERVVDDDDDDDEDDDDDGYGLDEELVPWEVSGKLGRERMRKLGKRGFAKMVTSKRNPFFYLRPGCVRGKHGLGINA